MNWDPVLVLQLVHDIPVYMPPCHAKSRPHTTTAPLPLFFSPIQLQDTPGAPFPLTSPIPPVRRWLVVHHPLISLHTLLFDQSSRPAKQPTPSSNSPDPSIIHFQSFPTDTPPQSDDNCQILGSWNPLGSAGRCIVEIASAGTRTRQNGFGLEPTSIQPTHYAQPYKSPQPIVHLVPTYSFHCLHIRHILLYQGPPNR